MHNDLFSHLTKEIIEIRDRNPKLSPDNAFVAWFLRAFVVENEAVAVQALRGGARDKGVDALFVDHVSRFVSLAQGKYHQGPRPPSEKRSDVIALADLGRALMLDDPGMFKAILDNADETVKVAL